MATTSENRPNPVNHAMLMGLEVGIWFAINFMIGAQQMQHPSLWLLSWMVSLYVIYGIYRAAQHYKRFECGDKITFGQAYSYIMWLFLCASLVAAIIRFAYLQWLDTAYLSKVFESSISFVDQLVAAGAEGAESFNKEEFASSLQYILTPVRFSVYYSMYDMLIGMLLGLVMAPFVVRRKARFIYPFGGNPEDNNSDNSDCD